MWATMLLAKIPPSSGRVLMEERGERGGVGVRGWV